MGNLLIIWHYFFIDWMLGMLLIFLEGNVLIYLYYLFDMIIS